jgi:hypothetical protein
MQTIEKQPSTSAMSWTSKAERKRPAKVDYYPELRSWVQHAILEAEKCKDIDKKDQLLDLLKEL